VTLNDLEWMAIMHHLTEIGSFWANYIKLIEARSTLSAAAAAAAVVVDSLLVQHTKRC